MGINKKVYKVIEIQNFENLINEEQKQMVKNLFLIGVWSSTIVMNAICLGGSLKDQAVSGICINLLAVGLEIRQVVMTMKGAIAGLKRKLTYEILQGQAQDELETIDVNADDVTAELEKINQKENEAIQLLLEMGYKIEKPEEMSDELSGFENGESRGMRR